MKIPRQGSRRNKRSAGRGSFAVRALFGVCGALAGAAVAQTPADSLSPVFRSDSSKTEAIRAVEAGGSRNDSTRAERRARRDSLALKQERRGPYVGLSAGVAFARHSGSDRFAAAMTAQAAADTQRVLQDQDPVHVLFPAGLLIGVPVTRHLDLLLRTEHFHYRVTGLAQKGNEPPTEFWYVNQGHLAGAGIRWLVPVSLLTVAGQPGLHVTYTHFWSFGPTGMRAPGGSVAARPGVAGAGYELQAGFLQDFDARWALTGSLGFSRLSFRSRGDWSNVVASTVPERAEWTLTSMRFALQGLYQFGRQSGKMKAE